jgi:hypothetical protein
LPSSGLALELRVRSKHAIKIKGLPFGDTQEFASTAIACLRLVLIRHSLKPSLRFRRFQVPSAKSRKYSIMCDSNGLYSPSIESDNQETQRSCGFLIAVEQTWSSS